MTTRLLRHTEFAVLVLASLLFGVLLSLVEARAALRFGPWLSRAALLLRAAVPLGLPALMYVGARWGRFGPGLVDEAFVAVARTDSFVLSASTLWSGLILSAGVLAYRRMNVPNGVARGTPSLRFILGVALTFGLAFVALCGRERGVWDPFYGVGAVAAQVARTLMYLGAPLLLWKLAPRPIRQRVRLAGLAVFVFLVGQSLVSTDVGLRFLNVFLPDRGASILGARVGESGDTLTIFCVSAAVLSVLALVSARSRTPSGAPDPR